MGGGELGGDELGDVEMSVYDTNWIGISDFIDQVPDIGDIGID